MPGVAAASTSSDRHFIDGKAGVHVVTRSEIADHIEYAFVGAGAADRTELMAAAEKSGARPELIAVLERLPDRSYASLRQLWTELPDIPVRG